MDTKYQLTAAYFGERMAVCRIPSYSGIIIQIEPAR
jgi:hypothetical protein